jgi:hypothetical protein
VKAVRILVLAAMAAMLTTLGVGSAVAAPTPTSVPGTCATYPVSICQAQILSSTTTPFQGQTIEVSGLGYLPNENVALTIGGISVGTAHTDGDGNFDPPVVVPATLLGDQPLTGTGASGEPYDVDSLVLNIRAAGTGPTTSGGGLASTGVDILTGIAVALALIGAGVLFARGGRRRHSHS